MGNRPGEFINRFHPNAPSAENLQPVILEKPATNIQNEIHFNVNVDHVQDYNDLIRQMQHDSKFERLIHTITFAELSGRSSFEKYKINI